ncbi:class I SAM-dependent methyltransferase [Streptomyces sp. TRM66268-LWL]|uniref:Class I SAM-dependent methyltransferase n=1 Tax=Streptomyces polyasparticus TaxID=2767826 RepID=A0ABR7SJT8_9ACTN|nr:class I SAM-dependent methyltransferase [Streptomyces polyasparticus]MBC9715760.1 class I SAM-dependent methyltransferase [Streptomyces polyasparticus]
MSTDTPYYGSSWETYWSITEAQGQVSLWDADPRLASALDLPRFADHLDPDKVLIDLGCGNGTQTRYLARHIKHVIGADASRQRSKRLPQPTPTPRIWCSTCSIPQR